MRDDDDVVKKKVANLTVLMSLYCKEKASNLRECLESLINQTVKANEWVIVKDGPLTKELEDVLNEYSHNYPGLIHFVVFEKNQGLGLALREGVLHCGNELIARMDTDDICVENRFELQLAEFENDSKIDICGGYIYEFEKQIDNIVTKRIVPSTHAQIEKYQKRRSAFNHMTVVFKKSSVLNAGNYKHCPLMEDDMLWVDMLNSGCIGMNLESYLVYARTGTDMISRRGGFSYFLKYKNARKAIYKTDFISFFDYFSTIAIQFFVALLPKKVRYYFFVKCLRK